MRATVTYALASSGPLRRGIFPDAGGNLNPDFPGGVVVGKELVHRVAQTIGLPFTSNGASGSAVSPGETGATKSLAK
ncbi:hypothetical protein [Caballeronia humi]|jgi:hypothetical protein|uniref:Uncharacterized protein n=1 Tax=Caballeronia humi TaxID=326474 RepID=A0A158HSC0_9BURK|nr:hypothetical protein [Caballeronia humi]SAL47275.1 hypothetical protein AWB65_03771 [Caballeronia humi]